MKCLTAVVIAVAASLLSASIGAAQGVQGGAGLPAPSAKKFRNLPVPIRIDRNMKAGDIVARGHRADVTGGGFKADAPSGEFTTDDGCVFNFGIEIALDSGSRTVKIGRGPDCTAVIDDIEDIGVVEPGERRQAAVGGGPLRNLFASLWNAVFPAVSAQAYTRKQVYAHLYTYGYGGANNDGLTALQAWLTWRFNFVDARLDSASSWACVGGPATYPGPGNCFAPLGIPPMFPYYTGWLATNIFYYNVNWGPAPSVYRYNEATYYFGNPNNYNHTIFNNEFGDMNGIGYCQYYYQGSIVRDPPVTNCQVNVVPF
jgi:hypothetical protein